MFAVLLAAVFSIWYAREHTLSIHTIVTTPREAFYWLTVLVTFALGTAVGDWTLELTGWSPGKSVLLPLALILAVLVAWKLGMGPVLSFWLAYILTRPLGANIGDYLASPRADGGLGLGTLGTSVVFLGTILAVVVYLTVTDKDRTEAVRTAASSAPPSPTRSEETTMSDIRTHRVLVVTDTAEPSPSLRDAIRHRAENGDVQFRLIVLNPARAELHLAAPGAPRQGGGGRDRPPLRAAAARAAPPTHPSSARSRCGTTRWTRSRRPCSASRSTRSSSTYRPTTSPPGSTRTSSTGSPTSTSRC